MKTKRVSPHIIECLTTRYLPRRIPIGSRKNEGCIYQGIVYRADNGYANHGMKHFFKHGFTQQNVDLDFDIMNGKFLAGHTNKVGISTTYNYHYALSFGGEKNIYVIDLLNHPFAIDINHSSRIHGYPIMDKEQCEVNVANNIHANMVFAHYDSTTQKLTLNPQYEGPVELE